MTDPHRERQREREAHFVRNLPKDRPTFIDGFPPILPDSDSDADGYDIIQDMRADGYFDDWD